MRHERSIQLIPDDLDRIEPEERDALNRLTPRMLRQHDVLRGRCPICKHEGGIDRGNLERRWPDVSLVALELRLLCRHCRNKEGNKFIASRLPRD